ncbi:GGDEF domain-containing protein [Marinagarivorans cellulosilyticus]|uniref:diguanylate cyclase n=1 Tax=Marinagarivorans cellulosilyticus TaxID=2721545 RepID=A0AAN1WGK4_9GAMM|nr:GGDEF domain-containing protein [Marinagarivorans cellulosilyticus]BCD97209.1 hypothetical protein MARGE09_P1410 [Marinagarivorans cellulosilyticus]
MITHKHLAYIRLAIGFASLILIAVSIWAPERRIPLASDERSAPGTYDDRDKVGGNSSVHWLTDQPKGFLCEIRDGAPFKACGITLTFTTKPFRYSRDDPSAFNKQIEALRYEDFRHIKGFEVDISYKGDSNSLRLYMRNAKERNIKGVNQEPEKFMSVSIQRNETNKPIFINLHEFHVPNWWMEAHAKSRLEAQPEFNNVFQFGIDVPYNIPNGTHILTVNKITIVKSWLPTATIYIAITAMWISVFLLEALFRVHKLYRDNRRYHQSLKILESRYHELQNDANQDALTKVYNRRGLDHVIEIIFNTQKGQNLCIAVLDIDHFKQVNDTFGHGPGDAILKQVAQRITQNLSDDIIVGRWGGEEFLLLSPNSSLEQLTFLAHKIRSLIAETPFDIPEKTINITISIGCTAVRNNETFSQAFGRADQALYSAKERGRNTVCTTR